MEQVFSFRGEAPSADSRGSSQRPRGESAARGSSLDGVYLGMCYTMLAAFSLLLCMLTVGVILLSQD